MKDITHLFQKYRECVRNLWNTYFFIDVHLSSYSDDILDRFATIDQQLFATLCLSPIGKLRYFPEYHRETTSKPIPF